MSEHDGGNMRLLFSIDKKDYDPNGTKGYRPSVRGIIIKDGRLAMVHSLKYDYYKFPGGGIDSGESHLETLVREVGEETGLTVIPGSVREYGYVYRVQKGAIEDIFIQYNYYYFCDAEDKVTATRLDDYEAEERFTLEYVRPRDAIETNLTHSHGEKDNVGRFRAMIERDDRVMEMLADELEL